LGIAVVGVPARDTGSTPAAAASESVSTLEQSAG